MNPSCESSNPYQHSPYSQSTIQAILVSYDSTLELLLFLLVFICVDFENYLTDLTKFLLVFRIFIEDQFLVEGRKIIQNTKKIFIIWLHLKTV